MNKQEAIKRLDALDAEAKELRKIIERGDGMEYDENKMYVAIFPDSHPYILMGSTPDKYFRWHSLGLAGKGLPTTNGWTINHNTGQAALDHATQQGRLYAFNDPREAITFFLTSAK